MLAERTGDTAQTKLGSWMEPFSAAFTTPTWQRVLVLIVGAILSPGRRTVAAALRVIGLDQDPRFTNYHRVLNRNCWSSLRLARCLSRLLVNTFVPDGPVVIGLDDTLERRWGAKIAARGIYRDPVRSSQGHLVKASGLRWLSVMLLPKVPWAGRVWGVAVPDRACGLGALCRPAPEAAQKADRLGQAGSAASVTLAAGSQDHRGGQQQLRRHRPAASRAAAHMHDDPPAPRRTPVQPACTPPARHCRAAARDRQTAGHLGQALG